MSRGRPVSAIKQLEQEPSWINELIEAADVKQDEEMIVRLQKRKSALSLALPYLIRQEKVTPIRREIETGSRRSLRV